MTARNQRNRSEAHTMHTAISVAEIQ